jgi:phage baseplate assembly protein gpV
MNNAATYLDLGTGAGDILRAADKGYTMSAYVKIDGDWSGNGNFIWAFAETNNVAQNSGRAIWFSAPGSSHVTTTGGWGGNAKSVSLSGAVTREVWHHVAYTQKGKTGPGNAKLDVDGVLKATGTIPALPGDFNTFTHNALAGPCFQGDNNLSQTMFTDFRIYNEVLDADQIEALAGDLADLKAVDDWAQIAASSTPAISLPVVIKSAAPQASVPFTLTTNNDGTWKVYDSPAGPQTVSGVTASFNSGNQELTLTASDNDLDAGYYYVSVTENGKAESARLALRVRDYLPDLIFELDFGTETGTTTASKGTAALNGSISYEDGITGKAGIFNGAAANYLAITDDDGESLLAGLKEFSVAFWVKQSDVNSWWFYAAPNTIAQINNTPSYVGALFQKSNYKRFNIERYLNARSSSFTTAGNSIPTDGTWKHVVLVFTETDYTAYIDGVQAGTSTSSIQPITGILGAASILYIGRANWGSGEGATGSIDEYKIYSKALNFTEINTLYTNENPSGGSSQSSGPVSFNFSGIPEDMSLSLSASSVQKTESLAVSVQNPEGYTDFEWWLDGVKQAENSGVYNVDVSSLSLGQHRVTVAALRGNVPCSARAAFTVIA